MITKITIIVLGLLTVVPHGENEGMTVLLRDAILSTPLVKLSDGKTECPVALHVPLIVQRAGTCKGDCLSFNIPAENPADFVLSLVQAVAHGNPEVTAAGSSAIPLLWTPVLQDVRFDGILPTGEPAPHDLKYPFALARGIARVDADCLSYAVSCPIVARFTTTLEG